MARNSEFKKLANLAKQRLKEGNYSNVKHLKNNFTNSYYYKNITSIKKIDAQHNFVQLSYDEDDKFNKKVFKLLSENEDNLSPIKELCDYEIFNKLNDSEKQSYILRLSEKFVLAKELYFKNINQKIG